MKVVVSLGGSTIFKRKRIDVAFLKSFAQLIKRFPGIIVVVTGGGPVARMYMEPLENLYDRDRVGIMITKANAMLLSSLSGIPYCGWIEGVSGSCIMGGSEPGHSTDTVAALVAEKIKADRFVNISEVGWVFDKPPEKGGEPLKTLNHQELLFIAKKYSSPEPGSHFIIDLQAARILARSNIESHFVGKEMGWIRKAIYGKKHKGTIVRD